MTEGLQAGLAARTASGTGSSSLTRTSVPWAQRAHKQQSPSNIPRSTAPSHIRALPGFPVGGKGLLSRPPSSRSHHPCGSDAERALRPIQPSFSKKLLDLLGPNRGRCENMVYSLRLF